MFKNGKPKYQSYIKDLNSYYETEVTTMHSKRISHPSEKAQSLTTSTSPTNCTKPTTLRSKESTKTISMPDQRATVHTEEEENALCGDAVIIDSNTNGPSAMQKKHMQVNSIVTATKRSRTKKPTVDDDGGEDADESSDTELGIHMSENVTLVSIQLMKD